ncbi:hypothetical protein [Thiolapillus sp.]
MIRHFLQHLRIFIMRLDDSRIPINRLSGNSRRSSHDKRQGR